MAIVGFSFTKIDAKKTLKIAKGAIEVKHNISIIDAEKTPFVVGASKSEVLKVNFSFDVMYNQELGKVTLEGSLIYADTKEILTESEKMWKKDRNLPDEVKLEIHRFILTKGIVKAMDLADVLALPTPIPLPRITVGAKKNK